MRIGLVRPTTTYAMNSYPERWFPDMITVRSRGQQERYRGAALKQG